MRSGTLPASSDKTNRDRLNRGGDRIANNALWRIVLVRMSFDPRARDYVDRRTEEGAIQEGLSKKVLIRCLKTLRGTGDLSPSSGC